MGQIVFQTKWYEFSQNNSGGRFRIDDKQGIGNDVWIEAIDPGDANRRAENIGLYFDGCEYGEDCDCCGDRWYRAAEYRGHDEAPETGYANHKPLGSMTKWYKEKRIFIHPIGKPFYEIKAIG